MLVISIFFYFPYNCFTLPEKMLQFYLQLSGTLWKWGLKHHAKNINLRQPAPTAQAHLRRHFLVSMVNYLHVSVSLLFACFCLFASFCGEFCTCLHCGFHTVILGQYMLAVFCVCDLSLLGSQAWCTTAYAIYKPF